VRCQHTLRLSGVIGRAGRRIFPTPAESPNGTLASRVGPSLSTPTSMYPRENEYLLRCLRSTRAWHSRFRGADLARDRNWLQRMGWQYIMRALVPIIPLARSLERSAGDLLWLLTAPDVRHLSGSYVDGRSKQPGSPESRDQAKIARGMEVANRLISDRLTARSAPPRIQIRELCFVQSA
jgi:hypothetical protein